MSVNSNAVKGGSGGNTSNSNSGSASSVNVKPVAATSTATATAATTAQGEATSVELHVDQLFRPSAMSQKPTQSGTYCNVYRYCTAYILEYRTVPYRCILLYASCACTDTLLTRTLFLLSLLPYQQLLIG
jgi:hypothetical protein